MPPIVTRSRLRWSKEWSATTEPLSSTRRCRVPAGKLLDSHSDSKQVSVVFLYRIFSFLVKMLFISIQKLFCYYIYCVLFSKINYNLTEILLVYEVEWFFLSNSLKILNEFSHSTNNWTMKTMKYVLKLLSTYRKVRHFTPHKYNFYLRSKYAVGLSLGKYAPKFSLS